MRAQAETLLVERQSATRTCAELERERTRALETLEHQRVALEAAEERADALERQLEEARAVIDELRGRLAPERPAGARDTGGADAAEAEATGEERRGRKEKEASVGRALDDGGAAVV